MVRKNAPTFEAYRDDQNQLAPTLGVGRSLGIADHHEVKTVSEQAAERIDRLLSQIDLPEEKAPGLRALLLADLVPLLRSDKDGLSMLDLRTAGLSDDRRIRLFLRNHGADLDTPGDLNYATSIFTRAVQFYDENMVDEKTHPIVRDLHTYRQPDHIYTLFKVASGHGAHRKHIPQACALLRIAAVIDYMRRDPLISMIPRVKDTLNSVAHRHVRKVGNDSFYHSGKEGDRPIPLVRHEPRIKTEDRIIMKLLHKATNRTAEVLDHIGYRWVTRSAADTIELIYKMFFDPDVSILPFVNIRIGETKQTMLNAKMIEEALTDPQKAQSLFASISVVTLDHQELEADAPPKNDPNVHSSKHYRAIQITVDIPIMVDGQRYMFPTEHQFLDVSCWLGNEIKAPHGGYVEKQKRSVTDRVLGNNLQSGYDEVVRSRRK